MIERETIEAIRKQLNESGALPSKPVLHSCARTLLQALDEKARSLDAAMLVMADVLEEISRLKKSTG